MSAKSVAENFSNSTHLSFRNPNFAGKKNKRTANEEDLFCRIDPRRTEDAALYQRIIRHIAETDKVLTEHIGSTDIEADEKDMTDSDIYRQDTAWLRECDMVIAECTNASLGVGYEMAFAESLSKPVHIFYDSRRTRLSAMLAGNPYFHIHPYSDEAELFRRLTDILRCPCSKTGCPRFGNCEACRQHHADSSRPRPCER